MPISILNGEYSINGGAFTSAAGTINNGQSVALRLVSAATISTEKQAEITISGVAISFLVTTTNILGGSVQGAQLNIAGVVTTMAGLPPDADGIGLTANFNVPLGTVIVGPHLYVADADNNKIRKIEISTGAVTTFAGSGIYGDADGVGTAAAFEQPSGITSDGTHLYIADTFNSKIRKIEIATGVVSTFAGSGVNGISDGGGTAASFHSPRDITTDGTYLYVADTWGNKIRKIEIITGIVTTLAGSGSEGNADGTGAAASFAYPRGITTDGTYLYVADTWGNKIRKIEIMTGIVTTLAGSDSEGNADGIGVAASFASPRGITTDGTHLYIADTGNHKIRKIEISTGVVTTLAGTGNYGIADGAGTAANFRYPNGITIDGTNLYVADAENHKIRKIDIATGMVATLAGSGNAGTADGAGAAANFHYPSGITTDGFALYVTDSENNTIRKIE